MGTMIQKLPCIRANISMWKKQKKKLANNNLNTNTTVSVQEGLSVQKRIIQKKKKSDLFFCQSYISIKLKGITKLGHVLIS